MSSSVEYVLTDAFSQAIGMRLNFISGDLVTRPDLGTKRLCQGCGAKFYDLQRTPIVCPKCGTTFQVVAAVSRSRVAAAEAPVAADDDLVLDPAVELVSLEEADEGASGGSKKGTGVDVDVDDDIEIEGGLDDDDAFLEPDEEGDDDVSDLIGGDLDDDEEA